MFKNRAITFKVIKMDKNKNEETLHIEKTFEGKTETIRHAIESLGAKMFLGVCVYILLDTHRQVSVAQATHRP